MYSTLVSFCRRFIFRRNDCFIFHSSTRMRPPRPPLPPLAYELTIPSSRPFLSDFHRLDSTIVRTRISRACCKGCCKFKIPDVLQKAKDWRLVHANRTRLDRRQFLMDCVRRWLDQQGRIHYQFETTDGCWFKVCRKAFLDLTGLGTLTIQRVHHRVLQGHRSWVTPSGAFGSIVAHFYRSWIKFQIKQQGEHMPDRPWCTFRYSNRVAFFRQFESDWRANPKLLPAGFRPSLPTFYKILAEFRGSIRWYRYVRFSKCAVCAFLNTLIAQAAGPDEKAKFQRAQQAHIIYQGFEVCCFSCFSFLWQWFVLLQRCPTVVVCSGKRSTTPSGCR